MLRSLRREGRTVVLASHRIEEILELCDRAVVIVEGTVRFIGPPTELGTRQTEELADLLAAETGAR
jgi:ABC-2 type transport system ATP-binding protein